MILPDRPRRTCQRAAGLSSDALAAARRLGRDAGYVVAVDQHGPWIRVATCRRSWTRLAGSIRRRSSRSSKHGSRPSCRRGRTGIIAEWDGGLLIAGASDPGKAMSLRTRLIIAFAAVVLIQIALLAFGLRQDMTRRLSQEYQHRVQTVVDVIPRGSRARAPRSPSGSRRSRARCRTTIVFVSRPWLGVESEREYLLDYAGTAMRLSGLSMLQIQDADGAHSQLGALPQRTWPHRGGPGARAEHTRGVALVTARGPEREFLALARAEPFVISGREFTIVGGLAVDEAFLARLARDRASAVSLRYPEAS